MNKQSCYCMTAPPSKSLLGYRGEKCVAKQCDDVLACDVTCPASAGESEGASWLGQMVSES